MKTVETVSFSALLASLYRGLDEPRPWTAFLEALARWMDASYAVLIIAAPGAKLPGTFVAPGADPVRSADYVGTFFADDPFQGLPDGEVTAFSDFVARLPAERYRAYRDYLALAGGEQVLAVDLRFAQGFEARFRVMRTDDRPDFSDADRERLRALVPHLRIAVGLFAKLQFAGAQHGVFHSAAEGFGLAMIVLGRDRHIVSSNTLGERFLAEGEGLSRSAGRLMLKSPAARAAVDAMLAAGGAREGVRRFAIPREALGDLVATARPINLPAIHSGAGALALFLSYPDSDDGPNRAALRDLFGLTPAEANLAARIARGTSLVEAARNAGISPNTAKTQLRAIFAKTGTHRQSQLAAKLAALGQ